MYGNSNSSIAFIKKQLHHNLRILIYTFMSHVESIAQSATHLSETELHDLIQTLLAQSWEQKEKRTARKRPFGLAKALFVVPDDFNAPLPEKTTP